MRGLVNAAVLVLMAVVGGALLVSLVARARWSENNSLCKDRLRRIGFALSQYESQRGHYPAGTLPNPDLPSERRLSWLAALAPDFPDWGGGDPAEGLDERAAWDAEVNRQVVVLRPPFLCDSNPNQGEPGRPGLTHYVGVAGLGPDAAALPLSDPRAGPFGYDRALRRQDIRGASWHKLTVVETARENGPWVAGGPATVRGLDPGGPPYLGRGGQFGCHPGGCNALFANGSVMWLSDKVSPRVLEAMATIASEGEVELP
jgi:hypothetical protein